MDDLISRKWLMECVEEGWIKLDTEKDENRFIHLVRDVAPSAERKKGHWIEENDGIIHGRCSSCGWVSVWQSNDVFGMDYCPNCGARMKDVMTRYEYMKMFGLRGQIDRPDDPPDEKFMEAIELISASFYYVLNEPLYEEGET